MFEPRAYHRRQQEECMEGDESCGDWDKYTTLLSQYDQLRGWFRKRDIPITIRGETFILHIQEEIANPNISEQQRVDLKASEQLRIDEWTRINAFLDLIVASNYVQRFLKEDELPCVRQLTVRNRTTNVEGELRFMTEESHQWWRETMAVNYEVIGYGSVRAPTRALAEKAYKQKLIDMFLE